jgi:hypothetical protein
MNPNPKSSVNELCTFWFCTPSMTTGDAQALDAAANTIAAMADMRLNRLFLLIS